MAYCGERIGDIRHGHTIRGRIVQPLRPLDHDDRQAKPSRRFDLAVTGAAARVFRYHHLDAVFLQHADFIFRHERTPRGDIARIRCLQRRLHRVDAADEVAVLGGRFERKKLLTAERQKHASARGAQRGNGLPNGMDALPFVTRLTRPDWTRKDNQWNVGKPCSLDGIGGNSGRIGMGGIHENIETLCANEIRQPSRATKPAGAHRHGLLHRRERAPGHGQQNSVAGFFCQPAGQNAGIRRAAKDENGACHDL